MPPAPPELPPVPPAAPYPSIVILLAPVGTVQVSSDPVKVNDFVSAKEILVIKKKLRQDILN